MNSVSYFVRCFIEGSDDMNYFKEDGKTTFETYVQKGTIVLDLKVGDTLKILEVSPDHLWCKAKIEIRSESKERRHIYGLSTFGSNAIQLKTSEPDLKNIPTTNVQNLPKSFVDDDFGVKKKSSSPLDKSLNSSTNNKLQQEVGDEPQKFDTTDTNRNIDSKIFDQKTVTNNPKNFLEHEEPIPVINILKDEFPPVAIPEQEKDFDSVKEIISENNTKLSTSSTPNSSPGSTPSMSPQNTLRSDKNEITITDSRELEPKIKKKSKKEKNSSKTKIHISDESHASPLPPPFYPVEPPPFEDPIDSNKNSVSMNNIEEEKKIRKAWSSQVGPLKSKSSKILVNSNHRLRTSSSEPPPETVPIKVYFKDGTYRNIKGTNTMTTEELIDQVVEKMDSETKRLKFYLSLVEVTGEGKKRNLEANEIPAFILSSTKWIEMKCKFLLTLQHQFAKEVSQQLISKLQTLHTIHIPLKESVGIDLPGKQSGIDFPEFIPTNLQNIKSLDDSEALSDSLIKIIQKNPISTTSISRKEVEKIVIEIIKASLD